MKKEKNVLLPRLQIKLLWVVNHITYTSTFEIIYFIGFDMNMVLYWYSAHKHFYFAHTWLGHLRTKVLDAK